MYLHEFQAKKFLREAGIPVAPFHVARSEEELEHIISQGVTEAILKIQIHAGGRGKAGGIKRAKSATEIREEGKKLLGKKFVTAQTGPEGIVVEQLLLDTPVSFVKEYYLALSVDRKTASVSIIASQEGGMEIENVSPEKIIVRHASEVGKLSKEIGIDEKIISRLVDLFFATDALLIEINPLVKNAEGQFFALDAKMQIDDNALFRHPEIAAMYDPSQLSEQEREAKEHDLAYVALDGDVGCMVNGAGLAMATLDLISLHGGKAANFLDVGGSATVERVKEGFSILFSDKRVKAVLVNIFGGIMNCEVIAKAFGQVADKAKVPIVIRMEGTNVEAAKAYLKETGHQIVFADSLDVAARQVVACRS